MVTTNALVNVPIACAKKGKIKSWARSRGNAAFNAALEFVFTPSGSGINQSPTKSIPILTPIPIKRATKNMNEFLFFIAIKLPEHIDYLMYLASGLTKSSIEIDFFFIHNFYFV